MQELLLSVTATTLTLGHTHQCDGQNSKRCLSVVTHGNAVLRVVDGWPPGKKSQILRVFQFPNPE